MGDLEIILSSCCMFGIIAIFFIAGWLEYTKGYLTSIISKIFRGTSASASVSGTSVSGGSASGTSVSGGSVSAISTVPAGPRGTRILNTRTVNGAPVDPMGKGRFYTACYGPDDGYNGKGAYSNALVWGPPVWSIALPRGREDGKDVSTLTKKTLLTTDFEHPLVAPELRRRGKWSFDDEYRFMKHENNRPRYLMVLEDGSERCVRVDDKCEGCYWGDRGFERKKGFDLDVYLQHSDATCWKHHPNQWVEIYDSPKCK